MHEQTKVTWLSLPHLTTYKHNHHVCHSLQIQPLSFQLWYKHFDLEEEETVRYAGEKKQPKLYFGQFLYVMYIYFTYKGKYSQKIYLIGLFHMSYPNIL